MRVRRIASKPSGFAPGPRTLIAVAFLVTAGVWALQLRGAVPVPTVQRPALAVEAATVMSEHWASSIEASGVVAPWQDLVVGSRLSGTPLTEVKAEVGDIVRQGQVLALFDDSAIRAELDQARAGLAQALASVQQTAANRQRALALQGSGAMSEQEILQIITLAATAQAQLDMAKAVLASTQLKLKFTRVLAPDDGVVSARSASPGSVAQPGAELFRIIRRGRLEWRAELNSAVLSRVRPGLDVHLRLPDGQSVAGHVRQVAPSLHPGSRLGMAYVTLEPDGPARQSLREAMYASGDIVLQARPALTVPAEAVVVRDGRSYVFGLRGDRVSLLPVTTGRRERDRIELMGDVAGGLAQGQRVVARGAGFLADGDLVRVVDAAAVVARPVNPP